MVIFMISWIKCKWGMEIIINYFIINIFGPTLYSFELPSDSRIISFKVAFEQLTSILREKYFSTLTSRTLTVKSMEFRTSNRWCSNWSKSGWYKILWKYNWKRILQLIIYIMNIHRWWIQTKAASHLEEFWFFPKISNTITVR